MLRLPEHIEVRLSDARGGAANEGDILVAVNLLASGRYYYGNLVGLTGTDGVVRQTREELERRYLRDQAHFPMDYKLELIECDPQIELTVLSGAEVATARTAVAEDFSIAVDIRESYARARNQEYASSLLRVSADSVRGWPLVVVLPLLRI